MAMVNPQPTVISPSPIFNPNVKDSRWLTLEVCREYTRNKCTRTELECKFAHPPPHVEVQNGRVTCCFDSIKGKCQRKDPPCKYLHPPQHLKEQLLQNGRNNLILKNLQMQALAANLQPMVPGMIPTVMYEQNGKAVPYQSAVLPQNASPYPLVAHPYHQQLMQNAAFSPYLTSAAGHMASIPQSMVAGMENGATVPASAASAQNASSAMAQAKAPTRADRLEQSSSSSSVSSGNMSNSWNGHGSQTDSIAPSSHYHSSQLYFQGMNPVPNMMPMIKRQAVAGDGKGGLPMYQPTAAGATAAYQQAALAMQLQQQQFVPVTIAGHPPSMPRF